MEKRSALSLQDGLYKRRGSKTTSAATKGESMMEAGGPSGFSALSALNLLKWKNNSVKPKMLGFKEMKRKKKDESSAHDPMNTNVFQLREYYSKRW